MIALITGASAGIGKACAYKFSENGYDLIVTGRRESKLKELQSELEAKFKNKIKILAFDIQEESQVKAAFTNLSAEWMNIDVLVNNAGLALGREGIDMGSMEDYNTMIDTNIKGLLYVSKAVIPNMKTRKAGHIINLSSTAAKEVYPGGGVYCATKHAVDALTKGMRIDLL
ncbi:MAG: SDR family NAD(P)-dependent oxidoreductase, partial [Bacteroidetes bacterium]|nr:SDR family NAD(P)-dependent oxidoreductase [Bacteroidota bacterium]